MALQSQGMVTAVFRNQINAENAYHWLLDHGYDACELSLLMPAAMQGSAPCGEYRHEFVEGTTQMAADAAGRDEVESAPASATDRGSPLQARSQAADGMALGGAIGTAVGASLAALAALGTSAVLPGLGILIAGPILAALAGGGAGAVTGGAIGALVGMGLSESNASAYEGVLRDGGVVLGVNPHNDEDRQLITTYFEKIGGESVCCC